MKWFTSCLNNKLVIYLFTLALCLAGLFSIYVIQIAPFPSLNFGNIAIIFHYPGANAHTVQTQITDKVETALRTIPDVQQISANTQAGKTFIEMVMNPGAKQNLVETQVKVLQAIASVHLPSVVKQPKIEVESGRSGLMYYMVTNPKMTTFELTNFVSSVLYPKFSSLPGVSIHSDHEPPAIYIRFNPERLAQYNLKLSQITQLINANYQSSPLGQIYLDKQPYQLLLSNNISNLPSFKHIIVGYTKGKPGYPIHLSDIASITFSPRALFPSHYNSLNGEKAAGIILYTNSVANPFAIEKASKDYVKQITPTLPAGVKIQSLFNTAKTMRESFDEITTAVIVAALLVLAIALVFLGRLKVTLIPIITIPICLLSAIIFVNMLGMTLNILTLLALVIAVGLVVDDAIVVVENITRYIEDGYNKIDAVIHGTHDIALTIIGITATLLAVYLPISFCSGSMPLLLKAFTVPLASAVFISGIVALTLTPVMASQLISDKAPNRYQIWFEKVLHRVIALYQRPLKVMLRHPWLSLLLFVALIATGVVAASKLPQSFFPDDPSGFVGIRIKANSQDTIDTLLQKTKRFKQFYTASYAKLYLVNVRTDPITGQIMANIKIQVKDGLLHQCPIIANTIKAFIKKHDIANTVAYMNKFSSWGSGDDLEFTIYGAGGVKQVNNAAARITELLQKSPIFVSADNQIHPPRKQLEFTINQVAAARYGIYRPDIANLLASVYGGYTLQNDFNIDGMTIPIIIQLDKNGLQNPQSLQQLLIYSPTLGQNIPLSKFVHLKLVAKPMVISTFNSQSSVDIGANFAPGYSFAQGIPYVNHLLHHRFPTMHISYEGNAKAYLQGNSQTWLIMGLGICCIYFLLSIIFRNIADPFIILLTVPFSVVGGALCLYLVGSSLNLYSALGFITLIGLITKHGVLIVQFANRELESGKPMLDAILTSTHHRFRPIIMTTLAMTLGTLPLLLSNSIMYVAKKDLGIVLVGGLAIGTCFSLMVVPVVYSLIKKAEG